jgi:LPS sulfotransferase NodH
MRDPRNGSEYDWPPRERVRRSYVIASLPRSGSTLLARALWDTGIAGAPGEYFNARHMSDFFARWGRIHPGGIARLVAGGPGAWRSASTWRTLPMAPYVSALKRHRTGPNGVFGVKLHWGHLERCFLRTGLDVEAALEQPRWIRIVRRDHVRQAVSYVRALQTGAWRAGRGTGGEPRYDFERISRRLEDLVTRERAWDRWLAARRIAPFEIAYESFAESYEPTVRAVLDYLEIEGSDRVAIPPPPLRRQADSDGWIERFRRDAASHGRALPGTEALGSQV